MNKQDQEFEKAINQVADFLLENFERSHHSKVESFKQFSDRKKAQIRLQLHSYRARFTNGYRVIIDEIAKTKSRESNS